MEAQRGRCACVQPSYIPSPAGLPQIFGLVLRTLLKLCGVGSPEASCLLREGTTELVDNGAVQHGVSILNLFSKQGWIGHKAIYLRKDHAQTTLSLLLLLYSLVVRVDGSYHQQNTGTRADGTCR